MHPNTPKPGSMHNAHEIKGLKSNGKFKTNDLLAHAPERKQNMNPSGNIGIPDSNIKLTEKANVIHIWFLLIFGKR